MDETPSHRRATPAVVAALDPRVARGVALRSVARPGEDDDALDAVVVEEPLEIRVDGDAVATTMRTPGSDADLALGFLFGEGIVSGAGDVGSIAHCGRPGDEGYGNVIDVRSAAGVSLDFDRILEGRRWSAPTSACGVCGRRSIDGLVARAARIDPGIHVDPPVVTAAVACLRERQPIFERTGGLHGVAILDAAGAVLSSAEDVGRHNAVDKAVGTLVRQGTLGAGARPEALPVVLAVSGRAGFEIVQKAAAAGIAVVASVSAPSSLAIDLAESAGVALAGFVRGRSFNVYANAWRLGLRPTPGR